MKILIWSFKYVPESGVGGRRWRKFGKYLCRRGHGVFVVKPPELVKSLPKSEITETVTIYEVGSTFGKFHLLLADKFRLYKYVAGKLAAFIQKCRGNIDEAEAWAKISSHTVARIIANEKIDVLVATGHPCSINYWAAMIKSQFPGIILVQDFRDTWNDETNYSLAYFSGFLRAKERSVLAEKVAISHADYVLNVSPGQSFRMLKTNPAYRDKFHVITNGYDPEDYAGLIESQPSGLRIVHAGKIRWHASRGLMELIRAISQIEQQMEACDLVIDFYGPVPRVEKTPDTERIVARFFNFHGIVSPDRIAEEVARASMGMIIFDKDTGYSTKLFDYIALSKPFLTISPRGELHEFSIEQGMPAATYNQNEIKQVLLSIAAGRRHFSISDSDYQAFSIANITEKFEKILTSDSV